MARWWVICLCAEWCGVCREYRPGFDALAKRMPDAAWAWIDVEDHADVMGDMDVETFPTLLIAEGTVVRFLGPMAPHIGVLERLIDSFQELTSPDKSPDRGHEALLLRIQDLVTSTHIAQTRIEG